MSKEEKKIQSHNSANFNYKSVSQLSQQAFFKAFFQSAFYIPLHPWSGKTSRWYEITWLKYRKRPELCRYLWSEINSRL